MVRSTQPRGSSSPTRRSRSRRPPAPATRTCAWDEINAAARAAGGDYCTAFFSFAREETLFASSRGSRITQTRARSHPRFEVTAVDEQSGRFATCASLVAPRGAGWEYIEAQDLVGEATLAAQQAREKLAAKPVVPGKYDLVID